jgi:flagellar basal-body rod protein FlgB
MDLNKTSLFGMMKQRLSWLGQRQGVLAQNIANADTPNYRPQDLKEVTFGELVKRTAPKVAMRATNAGHLTGQPAPADEFDTYRPKTYETSPAGNAVILEEQMAKVNETAIAHNLTTQLYRKHLAMVRTAIGSRR